MGRVIVFNATFNNISVIPWRSVLLVTKTDFIREQVKVKMFTGLILYQLKRIDLFYHYYYTILIRQWDGNRTPTDFSIRPKRFTD
jgi:hypothetical protein